MENLFYDLRYAARRLRRSPGFTFIAVLTMALGIGANTALFSVVNSVMLRPLPVEQPESLVEIYTGDSNGVPLTSSYPDYLDYRKVSDIFSGVLAFTPTVVSQSDDQGSQMLYGELVSGNFFSVLGLDAIRGRFFGAEQDSQQPIPPVAVVSHQYWETHLGASPQAVGSSLQLNGHDVPIIGIAPPKFRGLVPGLAADVLAAGGSGSPTHGHSK